MGPLQQFGVSAEPSAGYNWQPGCKPPITFVEVSQNQFCQPEKSSSLTVANNTIDRTVRASNYLRENLATFIERDLINKQQQHHHHLAEECGKLSSQDLLIANNMLASRDLASLDPVKSLPASQNSSPRPYSSQGQRQAMAATTSYYQPHHAHHHQQQQQARTSGLSLGNLSQAQYQGSSESVEQQQQQHLYQQTSPRILVNDQPVMCRYPTSTVHKSMLNSRQPNRQFPQVNCCSSADQHHIAYSRLISPTVHSSESISPSQSSDFAINEATSATVSAEISEQRQQQQQQQQRVASNFEAQRGDVTANLSTRLSQDVAAGRANLSSVASAPAQTGKRDQQQQQQQQQQPQLIQRLDVSSLLLPTSLKQKQSVGLGQSSAVCPDNKREEYMWNRQLERVSIAHQTYRTLPIVSPKPKARHDLATGTYMNYGQDLSYELALQSRPSSSSSREHERKIQQAIDGSVGSGDLAPIGGSSSSSSLRASARSYGQATQTTTGYSGLRPVSATESDPAPAFNYREYIESTRRAR